MGASRCVWGGVWGSRGFRESRGLRAWPDVPRQRGGQRGVAGGGGARVRGPGEVLVGAGEDQQVAGRDELGAQRVELHLLAPHDHQQAAGADLLHVVEAPPLQPLRRRVDAMPYCGVSVR